MNRQALSAHLRSQDPKKKPARSERYSEHHYRVRELGKLWGLSHDKITDLFKDEPGVVLIGRSDGSPGKRRYVILLIPASIAERVYEAMRKSA